MGRLNKFRGIRLNDQDWGRGKTVSSLDAFFRGWLLSGPRELLTLCNYDLYPPGKVVSCFKGAVPPLNNSHGFLKHQECVCTEVKGEAGRLNYYSFLGQPAITKFGRFVTSTQSSSHSFATETGAPY